MAVDGPLHTTLAGLRNREVSPLAFASLLPNVDAFMAIDDEWAFDAMRALNANGDQGGRVRMQRRSAGCWRFAAIDRWTACAATLALDDRATSS